MYRKHPLGVCGTIVYLYVLENVRRNLKLSYASSSSSINGQDEREQAETEFRKSGSFLLVNRKLEIQPVLDGVKGSSSG